MQTYSCMHEISAQTVHCMLLCGQASLYMMTNIDIRLSAAAVTINYPTLHHALAAALVSTGPRAGPLYTGCALLYAEWRS